MRIRTHRAAGRIAEDRRRIESMCERLAQEADALTSSAIAAAEVDRLLAFARSGTAPVELLDHELEPIGPDDARERFERLGLELEEMRAEVDALVDLLPHEEER